jgi:hypothetical protein
MEFGYLYYVIHHMEPELDLNIQFVPRSKHNASEL